MAHTHIWQLFHVGDWKYLECWKDACGATISIEQAGKLINQAGEVPYTGRHCPFCRQPEHSEDTDICGYRAPTNENTPPAD